MTALAPTCLTPPISGVTPLSAGTEVSPARLCRTNPLEDPAWDDLVMSHPDYNFFSGSAWARVLCDTYGHRPCYLVARDGKRLAGMLPVMEVRSGLTGTRGVSLPFTDECPPLTSDSVSTGTLLAQLTEYGQGRGWKYWECRGVRDLPPGTPVARTYYGHVLDLSVGEARLFDRFKTTVRTAIRKAEQAGVQVETSRTWDALRTFYALHCQTRRKHGLPPQSLRFFRKIHEHVLARNLGTVVIARYQQRPIAAAVFFRLGTKVIYKFGASDESAQDLRGNNLVMWHAIQWYARGGCASFHFGRTDAGADGLRRFKLGWGAREEVIPYAKFDCRAGAFVTEAEEPPGWKNAVLKRLPVFLLRALGELLYRHVA